MEKLPKNPEDNNKPTNTFTDDDISGLLKEGLMSENDPRSLMKKFKSEILPAFLDKEKRSGENQKQLNEKVNEMLITMGLDTHFPLLLSLSDRYQPLVLDEVRRIEKEYQCKTPSEIILAQTIAVSHARALSLENKFTGLLNAQSTSSEKNGYYSVISKEIDRSYRRMMNALTLLKQLKQPPIEVNIKTQNAFVAQNQQINAQGSIKPTETTNYEINEPK